LNQEPLQKDVENNRWHPANERTSHQHGPNDPELSHGSGNPQGYGNHGFAAGKAEGPEKVSPCQEKGKSDACAAETPSISVKLTVIVFYPIGMLDRCRLK
jgi:hypothetical protein